MAHTMYQKHFRAVCTYTYVVRAANTVQNPPPCTYMYSICDSSVGMDIRQQLRSGFDGLLLVFNMA